jgi:hypothetical protein
MNSTICDSISAYTEISCSDAETASAVALPIIQIGVVLIIIIALAIIGIVMKKYARKVQTVFNTPMNKTIEKLEQDKLLGRES